MGGMGSGRTLPEDKINNKTTGYRSRPKLGAKLSPTELRIVEGWINGKRNVHLAQELKMSVNTIKEHTKDIFFKTGCRTQPSAVAALIYRGEMK